MEFYFLLLMQSTLPPQMAELQRLRCRVAFEALRFRKEVQELGFRMVQRLSTKAILSIFSLCFKYVNL